jgi:biopolymer transport protein ExbD
MRTFRKRPWAGLSVDLTPLIDVIFLIIIFFIIMINFSEMHLHNVKLPKADEARRSRVAEDAKLPITIKTHDVILFERKRIQVSDLPAALRTKHADPARLTIQIRANENVPYEVIKQIMVELAHAGVAKVEFSAWQDTPEPLDEASDDAA